MKKVWVVKERGNEWEDSNVVAVFTHKPSTKEMWDAVRKACKGDKDHLDDLKDAQLDLDAPFDKGVWHEQVLLHP